MHYLLNIGNTHTQLAAAETDAPRLLAIHDTPALLEARHIPTLDDDSSAWTATASSVVPLLTNALRKTYGDRIHFLSVADFPHIDFSQVNTATLGIDRISNASAALDAVGHGPVAVFDFGTCIASEAIDSQNRFLGGAIAPGRMLMRKALHEHTAQLPMVPLATDACPPAIGPHTPQAILAGVDLGIIGLARHLVQETRRVLGTPDCTVFATGGDAPYFLANLPELTPAPALLTLRGINAAARR